MEWLRHAVGAVAVACPPAAMKLLCHLEGSVDGVDGYVMDGHKHCVSESLAGVAAFTTSTAVYERV